MDFGFSTPYVTEWLLRYSPLFLPYFRWDRRVYDIWRELVLLNILFGFLFGLWVSVIGYMSFYYTRYCWWPAVLRIGGDGCHTFHIYRFICYLGEEFFQGSYGEVWFTMLRRIKSIVWLAHKKIVMLDIAWIDSIAWNGYLRVKKL